MGDEPLEFIDLTDVKVAGRPKSGEPAIPALAISLSLLHPYQILKHGLLNASKTIGAMLRNQYEKQWARLRAENAAFRVLSGHALQSAPITVFDSLLISHVARKWRKAALVVAKALDEFYDASLIQTDDLVLAARLRTLALTGQLEGRGDLFHIRTGEVRLPKANSHVG
jgi:hypothetical protein